VAAPSLYDRLGVAPTASTAEIRAAYRRLARAAHPDHAGSAREMAVLNEAWRVLGDPARRAAYDRSAAAPRAVTGDSVAFTEPEPDGDVLAEGEQPAGRAGYFIGLPWLLVLAALALIFVFTAYAARGGGDGGDDERPDGLLQRGDCVRLRTGHPAEEAVCSGPHDAVVVDIVTVGATCPRESEAALGPVGSEHLCLGPG